MAASSAGIWSPPKEAGPPPDPEVMARRQSRRRHLLSNQHRRVSPVVYRIQARPSAAATGRPPVNHIGSKQLRANRIFAEQFPDMARRLH